MTDFNQLSISQCKLFADSDKYFNLFDKYIEGDYKTCLLYTIGNAQTIAIIMRKKPDCRYFIYDDGILVDCIKAGMSDWSKFKVEIVDSRSIANDQLWGGVKNMKFDRIIMNPPYSKNLHLKVLEKAIQHLTDDGKCVSLQPDNAFINPFRKYEKDTIKIEFSTKIAKHIISLTSINANDFNKLFNTNNWFGVGIFYLTSKFTNYDLSQYDLKPCLLTKILNKCWKFKSLRSYYSSKSEWKNINNVLLMRRTTHGNLPWYDENNTKITQGIEFNSNCEKENFKKSLNTWLYSYFNKCEWDDGANSGTTPAFFDQINPRTSKKGYESEWTDEDFYKFFNITEDEQKIIEETMKKYK